MKNVLIKIHLQVLLFVRMNLQLVHLSGSPYGRLHGKSLFIFVRTTAQLCNVAAHFLSSTTANENFSGLTFKSALGSVKF